MRPALLKAAHAGPSFAVTGLGTALALQAGRGLPGSLLLGSALLSGQLAIGWTNDLVDRERDVAAGRTDKPLATGAVRVRTAQVAATVALTACVPLSLANGWRSGLTHLVAVGGGLAYDLGVKRTRWSFLPFAASFGLLPSVVTLSLPGHPWPPWWATTAGALLGVVAHLANALPDLDDDRAAGVLGLPQRLGAARSRALGGVLLGAAAVLLAVAPPGPVGGAGLALLAVTAGLLTAAFAVRWPPSSRTPFVLTTAAAFTVVALLIGRGTGLA